MNVLAAIWLIALVISLVVGAVLGLRWLFGSHWNRAVAIAGIFSAGTLCLLGVDFADRPPTSDAGMSALFKLAVVALTAGALFLYRVALRRLTCPELSRRIGTCAAGLVLLQLGMATIAGWRFHETLSAMTFPTFNGSLYMEEIPGEALVTDQGRVVPVYRTYDPDLHHPLGLGRRKVTPTSEAESRHSNCHGWVFTRGRYIVDGRGVEMILADNGYQLVKEPSRGDVIVYRNRKGQVVHSGLVRSVDHGTVWIESKWGVGRRYVHRPGDQSYSATFEYYRTPRHPEWLKVRSRHLVKIRMESATLVTDDDSVDASIDSTNSIQMIDGIIPPVWMNNDLPIGAE